jgi:hypothetical protein
MTLAAAAAIGATGTAVADTLPLTTTANHVFYFSGSTAMDNPLKALFDHAGGICQAGTLDVYSDSTDLNKGHINAVVCKASVAIGSNVAINDSIALEKESNGGSLEGIIPVANGSTLRFFDASVAPAGCSAAVSSHASPYAGGMSYTLHANCTPPSTGNIVPTIGVADENPEVFTIGSPTVSAATLNKIAVTPWAQNVFGIAVSLKLYRALQKAQFPTATVNDDTLATMPTLSSTLIRAIYTGAVTSWTQVTDAAGNAISSSSDSTTPLPNTQIFVCRRGDSSGTNTSVDIKFLGQRCLAANASSTPMITVTTASNNCSGQLTAGSAAEYGCGWSNGETSANIGDTVFAGFGGGDVAACLSGHDRNNDYAIGNLTTNQAEGDLNGPGGKTAQDASTDTTGRFRFVKIDSKSPDLGSVVNGTYDFVFDNILVNNVNASAETKAMVKFLLVDFLSKSSAPLVQGIMNTQIGDPNFTAGVLVDASNPFYTDGVTILPANQDVAAATPPYVTGAMVKTGIQTNNSNAVFGPVSPFSFYTADPAKPENCAPSLLLPSGSNGVPTNP